MKDLQLHLSTFTDEQLVQLFNELQNPTYPEDSLLRKVIDKIYGSDTGIFVLRVQEMLWPMLSVITSRFISYSPHLSEKTEKIQIAEKIKKQPKIVMEMYNAIDQLINCDHQEHLVVRLNDPETEAVNKMKNILQKLNK